MESKHVRKLLQLYLASGGDQKLITTVKNANLSSSSSLASPPPPPQHLSLDSSMALTIFILLIALFFMGFFSVFVSHFTEDSTAEFSYRPRIRSSRISPRHVSSSSAVSRPFSSRRGLDSQAVGSLPVHCYTKATKHRIEDCAICLSEFQEGETVKVIPRCGHVFHVPCVDTWLRSHVSCPLCRNNQLLFPPDRVSAEEHDDTCAGVGPCLRRCSSCSSLEQRTGLERSLSF